MTAIVLRQLECWPSECFANVTTTEGKKAISSVADMFRLIYIASMQAESDPPVGSSYSSTRLALIREGLVDLSDPLRYPASLRVCTLMRPRQDRKGFAEVNTRIIILAWSGIPASKENTTRCIVIRH
jgi:hypothetical protein